MTYVGFFFFLPLLRANNSTTDLHTVGQVVAAKERRKRHYICLKKFALIGSVYTSAQNASVVMNVLYDGHC
jgi:hypothetical protein